MIISRLEASVRIAVVDCDLARSTRQVDLARLVGVHADKSIVGFTCLALRLMITDGPDCIGTPHILYNDCEQVSIEWNSAVQKFRIFLIHF